MSPHPVPADPVSAITDAWARERPGMSVDGMQVVTRVWQLAKLFGDARRRVVTDEGSDFATLDLLSVLRRSGHPYTLSTRELARLSMVTAGAISQRLTRAERDGLVRRTRVAGSRSVNVTLLDAGHRLVDRLVGRVADLDDDLLTALDSRQREEFDRLLQTVLTDLIDRLDADRSVLHVGDV